MELLFSNLLSGLIGVIIGVLFEGTLNQIKGKVILSWRRLTFRPKHPMKTPETFAFGKLPTSWMVLDGDGELEYTPETIECNYDPHEEQLPPDLIDLRKHIYQQEDAKRQRGLPYRWNGKRYRLDKFVMSRTSLEENLLLHLWFGPSDYFTFLATNMSLDFAMSDEKGNRISPREKYLQTVDWFTPVRFFSNSFGISLAVITSDGCLVVTQRSEVVGSRPAQLNVSMDEGLSRLLDRNEYNDAPDVYRCAIRGAAEELGIEFKRSDIIFLSFGVDTRFSQWGLLGMAKTDQTFKQILEWRAAGVKDKWENTGIRPVPFGVDSVVRFVLSNNSWAPSALGCIYHALVHEFGRSNVDLVIRKHSK